MKNQTPIRLINLNKSKAKISNSEPDAEGNVLHTIDINGYNGGAVDLTDMGFDYPVVYAVNGIEAEQKTPILYEHNEAIGHTTSIQKSTFNSKLNAKGVLSLPGDSTEKVKQGVQNEFPFQASMGLDFYMSDVDFEPNGVNVNDRKLTGPHYVVNKSKLVELSVTPFGRDSSTSTTSLSKEEVMTQLMRVRNQKPDNPEESTDTPLVVKNGKVTIDGKEYTIQVENTKPEPGDTKDLPEQIEVGGKTYVVNTVKTTETLQDTKVTAMNFALLLDERNEKHNPEGDAEIRKIIRNSIKDEWDDDRLSREIKFHRMENGLSKPPGAYIPTKHDNPLHVVNARLALSLNVRPEVLVKNSRMDQKAVDEADSMGQISLKEVIAHAANSYGGSFTGHGDVEQACTYLKNVRNGSVRANNSAFGTFDLPNAFENLVKFTLEDRFEMEPPFAPKYCKEGSTKDFRPDPRLIINGGEIWEGLNQDGSIKLTQVGEEDTYSVRTRTTAQGLVLRREHVVNDSMDVIGDIIDLMVEGAIALPDIKFVKFIYGNTDYWQAGLNKLTGAGNATLNRDNLEAAYYLATRKTIDKGIYDVNTNLNTKFDLITGMTLEPTAFDLVEQAILLANTTPNSGQIGEKNFWHKRVGAHTFTNLDNTTYHASAAADAWLLLPQNTRYAPAELTYLNNRKSPTTEVLELPWEYLGWGIKGYWDIEINARSTVNTSAVRANPNEA